MQHQFQVQCPVHRYCCGADQHARSSGLDALFLDEGVPGEHLPDLFQPFLPVGRVVLLARSGDHGGDVGVDQHPPHHSGYRVIRHNDDVCDRADHRNRWVAVDSETEVARFERGHDDDDQVELSREPGEGEPVVRVRVDDLHVRVSDESLLVDLLAGALVGHERADKEDALRETVAPEQRDLSVALQRALVQASREHVVGAVCERHVVAKLAHKRLVQRAPAGVLQELCLRTLVGRDVEDPKLVRERQGRAVEQSDRSFQSVVEAKLCRRVRELGVAERTSKPLHQHHVWVDGRNLVRHELFDRGCLHRCRLLCSLERHRARLWS
mmetsp:Transcript_39263/g.92847  ORF Transcript_39263/g.92847 Transcript_39263/m.92847 type:complete len:325 (+) Transcript_39263:71-1045(+)